MRTQSSLSKPTRHGFTVLELLMVIVIIGILAALLLPAILRIFQRGDTARVVAEMNQIDQALVSFQQRFGEYPPSSLRIPIAGAAWETSESAKIRAIWPEFDFTTNGGLANTTAIYLNGAECLVFFLGGIQSGTPDAPILKGFSKNPRTPWTSSENPDGPFMEFDLGRIVNVDPTEDLNGNTTLDPGEDLNNDSVLDTDSAFEYVDPLPDQSTPYLYISAAGKRMNRDNDNYIRTQPPLSAAAAPPNYDDYDVFITQSQNMSMAYFRSDSDNDGSNLSDNEPYHSNTYQLISPGDDAAYGVGGSWESGDSLEDLRATEADNITNFSGGGPLN